MDPLAETPDRNPKTADASEPDVAQRPDHGRLDLESPTVVPPAALGDAESAVDELLGQLQDGLQKAEAKMASILESIVDDNALILEELESALSDMEAALANE